LDVASQRGRVGGIAQGVVGFDGCNHAELELGSSAESSAKARSALTVIGFDQVVVQEGIIIMGVTMGVTVVYSSHSLYWKV
jgi:hypothetical protein